MKIAKFLAWEEGGLIWENSNYATAFLTPKVQKEPKKSRGSYENSQVLDLGRRWTHLGKFQLCHRIPHTYSLKKNSKKCAKKFPKKKVKTKCTWLLKKYGFGFFAIYLPCIA